MGKMIDFMGQKIRPNDLAGQVGGLLAGQQDGKVSAASLEGATEDDQIKAKVLMAVNASKSGWSCAACFCAFGSNPAGIMKVVAYSGPPYYRFYLICRKCAAAADEKITDRIKAHL